MYIYACDSVRLFAVEQCARGLLAPADSLMLQPIFCREEHHSEKTKVCRLTTYRRVCLPVGTLKRHGMAACNCPFVHISRLGLLNAANNNGGRI